MITINKGIALSLTGVWRCVVYKLFGLCHGWA